MIVGLGNPGAEHAATRHNVGFAIVELLRERWQLGRARDRYRGRLVEGRLPASLWREGLELSGRKGGVDVERGSVGRKTPNAPPRVALLCPQTYMNGAGRSVGPARGALKVPLERVVAVHDEIDLPFGEVRTRLGGGLAGHNGLKSLKRELGSGEFRRVRVGVGRPASTDPEIVSAYVLGRFREPAAEVDELLDRACHAVEQTVLGVE